MMLPPDLQRIEHIRDYCVRLGRAATRFGDSFDALKADEDYQAAAATYITQIGELVNGLSDDFRRKTSSVMPWHEIKAMRNRTVHGYDSWNLHIVWNIITIKIPELKAFCDEQLAAYAESSALEHK